MYIGRRREEEKAHCGLRNRGEEHKTKVAQKNRDENTSGGEVGGRAGTQSQPRKS